MRGTVWERLRRTVCRWYSWPHDPARLFEVTSSGGKSVSVERFCPCCEGEDGLDDR